jgi:hypothetical protein
VFVSECRQYPVDCLWFELGFKSSGLHPWM